MIVNTELLPSFTVSFQNAKFRVQIYLFIQTANESKMVQFFSKNHKLFPVFRNVGSN